jgi:hypothetical protein
VCLCFCHCDKVLEKNFKGGKIYLAHGFKFQRFRFIVPPLPCFWACDEPASGCHMVQQGASHFIVDGKQSA